MLRLLFTLIASAALLLGGGLWFARDRSADEVMETARPWLERGMELAREAPAVIEAAARSVPSAPEPPPVARKSPAKPPRKPVVAAEPAVTRAPDPVLVATTPPAIVPPPEANDPLPVEVKVIKPVEAFREGPLAGEEPAEPVVASAPPADLDETAALVRRMLFIQQRLDSSR